LALLFS